MKKSTKGETGRHIGKCLHIVCDRCKFTLITDKDKACPRCERKICDICGEKTADAMGNVCINCDHNLGNREREDA